MTSLIGSIKDLNRKERFHLLHDALGFENQTFTLCRSFLARLSECLDLSIPFDAYVAMDYQIGWLERAFLGEPVKQNIQDIDLLVAFEDADATHLILMEAKGDSAWDNEQLRKKAKRLGNLFPQQAVEPHFVLTSPRKPKRIKHDGWPCWMLPQGSHVWMCLHMPAKPGSN